MSTVLLTGATGTLGARLLSELSARGDEVRVLSRRVGAGIHVGDLATGAGVKDAARGAELIVHAASDTKRGGRTDLAQTEHLLEAAAGARHLLYVSIVGIDRIPFAYYRRKLACEQRIAAGSIPYTILRATQFHELVAFMLHRAERLPVAPLPLDFRFQTVAPAEVANLAAGLVHDQPGGRCVNFGGPEVLTLGQMTELWRQARGRPRRTVRLRLPGRVARAFRAGRNTCPEQAGGRQTWAQFVASDARVHTAR